MGEIVRNKKGQFEKGQTPWNKGLKLSKEWKRKLSLAKSGRKRPPFTAETLEKFSKVRLGEKNQWFGKMPPNIMRVGNFGNVKRGWYKIGAKKFFFRSNWEANYARYLDWLKERGEIKKWEYEKDVFIFHNIKFGTRSYRPDFKVFNNNGNFEYHEVKGWMTPKSKTQLKRMAKYYPEIKIVLIDQKYYTDIKKKLGRIVGFE